MVACHGSHCFATVPVNLTGLMQVCMHGVYYFLYKQLVNIVMSYGVENLWSCEHVVCPWLASAVTVGLNCFCLCNMLYSTEVEANRQKWSATKGTVLSSLT